MIRPATPDDVPAIAQLIRGLAEYERLAHAVAFDEAKLREHLFGPRPYCEGVIAEDAGDVVGFGLVFHHYSTFRGQPGIYLEDLFVKPERRGKGHGKALLIALVNLAVERDCGRLEWSVLNWNEPAIEFYKSLGARPMDEWTVYRLMGEEMQKLVSYEDQSAPRSPSGVAAAATPPSAAAPASRSTSWRLRTPPPAISSRSGNASRICRHSPTVPGPMPVPTRASSSTITRRIPTALAF